MRQEIGEGTTSRVFLAIRRSDRRKFACKVVDKRLLAQDKVQIAHLLKQLRKEVDILQRLTTRTSSTCRTWWRRAPRYTASWSTEGGELYDHLYEHGPMESQAAAEMLFGLMSAVAHMHDRDVGGEASCPVPVFLSFVGRRRERRGERGWRQRWDQTQQQNRASS